MDFAWREGTLPTCGYVGYFTFVIPASGIPQNAKFQNGVHLRALSPIQPRRAITEASYYMQGQMRQASTGVSRPLAYRLYNAPARFLPTRSPRCTPLLLWILGEGGRRIRFSLLSSLLSVFTTRRMLHT